MTPGNVEKVNEILRNLPESITSIYIVIEPCLGADELSEILWRNPNLLVLKVRVSIKRREGLQPANT